MNRSFTQSLFQAKPPAFSESSGPVMVESINLESAVTLNAHADRLFASLFSLSKSLPLLKLTTTYKDLLSSISDPRVVLDHPKLPHLSQENVLELGGKLREPYAVTRHLYNFHLAASGLLNDLQGAKRAVDFGWNYLFARAVYILFQNTVRLWLFASAIPDLEKAMLLYQYCYFRVRRELPPDHDAALKFIQSRSAPVNFENELKGVVDSMGLMFKGIVVPLQKVLTATQGYEWNLVNLSDNPEPIPSGQTFFRPEYLVMIDLDRLVNAFLSFAIISPESVMHDGQFLELFHTVASQRQVLELHGDVTVQLRRIFELLHRRRAKKLDVDMVAIFDGGDDERQKNARGYRRRRLTMALAEALRAIQTDLNSISLKLPVVLALVGWANYEISSSLTSTVRGAFDGKFLALLHATVQIVGSGLRLQELIRRFTLFNLREYDAPYLDTLMNSFHFSGDAYARLQKISTALKLVDIKEYDNGVRYDFSRLQLYIYQLVNYFTQYSADHGVLHLSQLFGQISLLAIHLESYTSFQTQIFASCPLPTYWRFTAQYSKMTAEIKHYAAGRAYILVALCHYYVADRPTVLGWPGFREHVVSHYADLISDLKRAIFTWSTVLRINLFNELTEQLPYITAGWQNQQYVAPWHIFLSSRP
jgi:hypothetical protein